MRSRMLAMVAAATALFATPCRAVFMHFDFATDFGTFQGQEFFSDPLTVTGSADVVIPNVGVAGGFSDRWVDGDEFLDFTFNVPVNWVRYSVNGVAGRGVPELGLRTVEAFGLDGGSLGTTQQSGNGVFLVSGIDPISSFRIMHDATVFGFFPDGTEKQSIGISMRSLFFNTLPDLVPEPDPDPDPIPEPSTLALLGIGLVGIGFARTRMAA